MNKILLTTLLQHIPSINTRAYKLLALLADGTPHTKTEIMIALGDDPRSARQALTGKAYGYWLIHNTGAKKAVYQLDERHISGNSKLDSDARVIACKRLRDRSKQQCERETNRYPRAIREQIEANTIYQECFNFTEQEKPTPVQ